MVFLTENTMPPETDDSTHTSTDTTDTLPNPSNDFGNIANAAAKAHINRWVEKSLPGVIAAAVKPFQDELAALRAPKTDDDESGKKNHKASPEVEAMKARIEELTGKFTSEQQARAAAEKSARDDRAHNALKSELAAHVNPALLGILTDSLYHMRKVVDFDEDGSPLFKSTRTDAFGDPEVVRMPLKDGVAQFLKSEEAKAFLPAPGVGSGATPIRRPGSKSPTPFNPETASDADKIRYAKEVSAKLAARGMA